MDAGMTPPAKSIDGRDDGMAVVEPGSDDWRMATAITLLRTQGAWAAADAVASLDAELERLREERRVWQEERGHWANDVLRLRGALEELDEMHDDCTCRAGKKILRRALEAR